MGLTPKLAWAVSAPMATATVTPRQVSTAVITSDARKRGTTRYSIGSTPHMRSASTCSVTIMVPISAAMPAPTRVASIIAVSDGPNSWIKIFTNSPPTCDRSPVMRPICRQVWNTSTMPMKPSVTAMNSTERLPTWYICRSTSPFGLRPPSAPIKVRVATRRSSLACSANPAPAALMAGHSWPVTHGRSLMAGHSWPVTRAKSLMAA